MRHIHKKVESSIHKNLQTGGGEMDNEVKARTTLTWLGKCIQLKLKVILWMPNTTSLKSSMYICVCGVRCVKGWYFIRAYIHKMRPSP